MAFPDQLQVAA